MSYSVELACRYIDDDEIVLSLKKMDGDVKWPSLEEEWSSLTVGVSQLLKGTSVYIVGNSSEINWAIAKELATGLEYAILITLVISLLFLGVYSWVLNLLGALLVIAMDIDFE